MESANTGATRGAARPNGAPTMARAVAAVTHNRARTAATEGLLTGRQRGMIRRHPYAPAVRQRRVVGVLVAALLLLGAAAIVGRSSVAQAAAASATLASPNSVMGGNPAVNPAAARAARPALRPGEPGGTASTTIGGDGGRRQLSVTPARGLPPFGAAINVRGSGYNTDTDLWVAVCEDDGAAPASLAHCVGGAIPGANATSSWGVVTSAHQPPYPGPVTTRWRNHGSFDLTLRLLAAAGQDADCVANPCSVYTRSSKNGDRSQDARVPVRFVATQPPTSGGGQTSQPGGAPTTQTLGTAPTTVAPDSVAQTSLAAGATQVIVFSGFQPSETVDVTLYSDPISLPPVRADGSGKVTISFTVPPDLPAGEHLIQAVGQKSGRVGIAQFEVGDAAVTTGTATDTSATDMTTSGTAAATDTASDSAESTSNAAPTPDSSSTAESALVSTDAAVAAGAPGNLAAGGDTTGAGRLIWLWVVLGVVVLIGGAAGIVLMLRRRRDEAGGEPLTPVEAVVPSPGWAADQARPRDAYDDVPDRAGWPVHATDAGQEYARAGSMEPGWQMSAPGQFPGGVSAAAPTEAIYGAAPGAFPGTGASWVPGAGGSRQSGPAGAPDPELPDSGPATEQWQPEFSGGTPSDPGPATEQWRPDFGGGAAPSGGEPSRDQSPGGGRHRSE
ncbi:MAG: hypothetical protein BGO26_15435 [Actinobacteria bacterium 69-20]|nr:MAG: hypothetical protein BGO26_15435 [Actinobacteria bacterium 69-20]